MLTKREKQIAKRLLLLGVAPQNAGYHYLLTAINLAMADRSSLTAITKSLYQQVGEKHHVSWQNVERCIRNAIKTAWAAAPPELWLDCFGSHPAKAPSNGNFIAQLVLLIQIGESA